ncbi:hypothetical protein [Nocardioides perillae]|uniref:Uncharacterized protein n=1 Tax=Nocardioides perillae TaxID=1119534 RepID=A0A7Y9UM41_9ACTN|nr:hypothetical protein [Nocardioides perillae]NYG55722.1 hypothetical protein [Nocardioides perillae]
MSDGIAETVIHEVPTRDGQHTWTLTYRPWDGDHFLRLLIDGQEHEAGGGFDIPAVTEIGFAGGLTPGKGDYILYGLTSSRVARVRAESDDVQHWSEVGTREVVAAAGPSDGSPLRCFVLVRPPVDDVRALVGLDADGQTVQRIVLP